MLTRISSAEHLRGVSQEPRVFAEKSREFSPKNV